MTTKFEQLIEYVINDEDAKAKALFHEIVVEKSRSIYEEIMANEEADDSVEEAKKEEEESIEEARHESEESVEEAKKEEEESIEEAALGGDQSDDLLDDVEAEETGISMEGAEEGEEESGSEDLEDRVVDLEDKLDELMAEFEALMGDEGADDAEVDMDLDTPDMDAEEVVDDEMETEGMMGGMMENVTLKAAPAPTKSEEGNINKKAVVAANSGAKGAVAKPVHTTGETAQGRPAPSTKDLIGKVQNTPAQGTVKQAPATKPHLAQATGVNTKSPLPKQ